MKPFNYTDYEEARQYWRIRDLIVAEIRSIDPSIRTNEILKLHSLRELRNELRLQTYYGA